MEIVLIGTGNTASILGRKLKAAGHDIVQIYGRDPTDASNLAYELDTESTNYWSIVNRKADLYIIAVSDIAVEEVTKELGFSDKVVVHTAASVSMDVLRSASDHYGILYPLQSLKKETEHLPDIPLIVDASDAAAKTLIQDVARSISDLVVTAGDEERMKLHLAAVFCNNFVNHLYALMEDYCKKEGIDFNLLKPLIKETAVRIMHLSPKEAQTGPAVRHDTNTIEKHLQLLENYPHLKNIYQVFSTSIGYNL